MAQVYIHTLTTLFFPPLDAIYRCRLVRRPLVRPGGQIHSFSREGCTVLLAQWTSSDGGKVGCMIWWMGRSWYFSAKLKRGKFICSEVQNPLLWVRPCVPFFHHFLFRHWHVTEAWNFFFSKKEETLTFQMDETILSRNCCFNANASSKWHSTTSSCNACGSWWICWIGFVYSTVVYSWTRKLCRCFAQQPHEGKLSLILARQFIQRHHTAGFRSNTLCCEFCSLLTCMQTMRKVVSAKNAEKCHVQNSTLLTPLHRAWFEGRPSLRICEYQERDKPHVHNWHFGKKHRQPWSEVPVQNKTYTAGEMLWNHIRFCSLSQHTKQVLHKTVAKFYEPPDMVIIEMTLGKKYCVHEASFRVLSQTGSTE